ncbi:MAG: hypothetical protein WKG07_27500 [Hymenobacter sp.]
MRCLPLNVADEPGVCIVTGRPAPAAPGLPGLINPVFGEKGVVMTRAQGPFSQ